MYIPGTLPSELGYIGGLRAFGATGNLIGGTVPAEWFTLTKMGIFYIDENEISGPIPNYLDQWTDLSK